MQIRYVGHRFKGLYQLARYASKWEMTDETAKKRYEILRFWEKYGLEATMDAFKVSRRTLYIWKSKWKESGLLKSLGNRSRAPHTRRHRLWPREVRSEIQRLRKAHPNLSKEKIHPFLQVFCEEKNVPCPSSRTIGRLIADAPDKMRHAPIRLNSKGQKKWVRPQKKMRKPKGFVAQYPGHCVALDTIERTRDGMRRYLLSFKDLYSRFGFSIATPSHTSKTAKTFLDIVQTLFPFPIEHVLTDNGSEFMKDFKVHIEQQGQIHWHTYPKTPKMNAACERFNRTLQEEFVDYHEELLFEDLHAFNDKLFHYLLWFNAERPHWALQVKQQKCKKMFAPLQYISFNHHECNLGWPDTGIGF